MFTALMLVLSPVPQEPQQSAIAPEVIHRVEQGIAGGFDMANPGHRMLGSFSEKGVSLEGDGWSAGLALAAWGRAGEMSAAVPVEPRAEGCRVEYYRPGITEWYVNGPRGLEQGFTVAAAPAGDGPVRIQLAIDGGLEVEVLKGARDARLLDGDGRAVFHYVGLTAWDATGRHLAAALSAVECGLALEVFDQGAVYPLTVDPWMGTEVDVLTLAAWPWYEEGQGYGVSVALQGDTLVVGAPSTSIAAVYAAGAVHIHYRNVGGPDVWGKVVQLAEPPPEFKGNFGGSVALDGDTLVVGAEGQFSAEDSVHVFERNQGGPDAWGHVKELVEIPSFGEAVAIDSDTLVVGCYDGAGGGNAPSVFVFGRNEGGPGNWGLVQQVSKQTPAANDFGMSLAVEGDTLLVGESLITPEWTGAVEVFERIDGVWTGVQTINSEDGFLFGYALALDGDSLLVGAYSTDAPGLDDAGAAYYFEHVGGAWVQIQKLTASTPGSGDYFGVSVALLDDTALIGASHHDGLAGANSGASYLFRWEAANGAWEEKQELTASNGGGHYGHSVALDGNTGAIGAPSFSQGTIIGTVRSAAFDPLSGTLYGVSTSSAEGLVRIDTSTGAGTNVGPTGFQEEVLGLAFDPGAGILYGTDDVTRLIQIDTSTGVGQVIGDTGFDQIQGLAFDTSAGVLYGVDGASDSLVRIDPATGAAVAVGPTAPQVNGLDYDSWTDTLYGSDHVADQLLAIDKHTGASTLVGQLGFPRVDGLAFDAASGTLYGIDKTEDGTLITIDTSSGAGTAVGQISTFQASVGAAYVIAIEFEAETYCTAGTSASGCQALIGATGNASASASSGFSLTISGVEGQKEGLFFCGTNGRQANPWGNGTSFVCVVPPRWRAGLLTGVGTVGACDGSFSQDLNGHWCSTCPKPLHNPGAGALAQAQLWYRDPASTSNQTSSMSDAIEFLVGP